ncbi:TIR domain-containing protein [Elizabethkingia anophelis]|uniref:TIR domain-containing protein n=1 Tax=Elizabethkingia anophelis TaxID=1117645 RepID=UPI00201114B4|nr:nucleotide-binding protein [Elizabethkingia anophelis]EJC8060894.1 nucleotide-binding protein [Elizabethkingia anophelis]MCL1640834.1 nucleotide-binding protein [Elizabethkingia anophelis]MCL1646510.1 nucleotide-binding protein [Elizabethkingia anophelis]MDV3779638.1 nucleotide-binding protein [Elizabethkingia anophelis]MDV3789514.1 nucleotide-binding protein [Elizabethkingia anophelis]
MDSKLKFVKDLIDRVNLLRFNDGELEGVLKKTRMVIKKVFGENSDYLGELKRIGFYPIIFTSASDRLDSSYFNSGKKELLALLDVMLEDLNFDIQESTKTENNIESKNIITEEISNDKIFIVHGHNVAMKQEVARTLGKLSLEPIILHEQPDGGKTIIEKFTDYSDVGFAIILLSADDTAYQKNDPDKIQNRARQNVILELGYFLGKLGRNKVLSLYEENSNLEIPSDYMGVLFTPYDNHGSWKTKLARELRHVGYEIDAEKIVNL